MTPDGHRIHKELRAALPRNPILNASSGVGSLLKTAKEMIMSHGRSPKLVPVYRMLQFTRTSPCQLGKACPACLRFAASGGDLGHYYFRGVKYICERAEPAPPAFYLTRRKALSLVRNGMARLIHEAFAIQLTFSVVTNIRDESCKADEELVMSYLAGSRRARIAIYEAWSAPPPSVPVEFSQAVPIYPFV